MHKKVILFSLLGVLIGTNNALAQLNRAFQKVFDQFLVKSTRMSPGQHGQHYIVAAEDASRVLAPALNTLIASNVRLFTSTSTIAGITFDWSSGNPVSINESLGPILAETAETFGKGRLNLGFEHTYLNLAELRGLATQDIRFSFIHEDVNNSGVIGDVATESDFIDLTLGMDVNASIFALFATVGLTNDIDVGLAIPFAKVNVSGEAKAVFNGPTAGFLHFFGTNSTSTTLLYDESATGLGDIAVRLKYNFVRAAGINLATLLDVGLPTGHEEDLLGTGKIVTKFSLIGSRKLAQFTPHFNIGYEHRPAKFDSDELKFIIGFDQKMAEAVAFAVDFLGEFDIVANDAIRFFPEEAVTILDQITAPPNLIKKVVDLTNIPERNNDNTLNASFGFRVAPSERFSFLANVLVPLNNGGLRSSVAPTVGLAITF